MQMFQPEQETCPICKSTGNCHIHDYYGRNLIDFHLGKPVKSNLCVMRVFCESCSHAHAILPDVIVPYSSYSLPFILSVLGTYFSGLLTIDELCFRYGISRSQLYKWTRLWKKHKSEWMGVLQDLCTPDQEFFDRLCALDPYSSFSQAFVRRFAFSFLQSHKNPMPIRNGTAGYCQSVFAPDYSIW